MACYVFCFVCCYALLKMKLLCIYVMVVVVSGYCAACFSV